MYGNKNSNMDSILYYIELGNVIIDSYRNSSITVIFHGKEISILSFERDKDVDSNTENRYYFSQRLRKCEVHKPDNNFFI
ncbi:MAG: hypothetical protein ACR5KV_06910 [Wolbachia sp.]